MIIVGEKINASAPSVTEAVAKRDARFIVRVAREQAQAGAHFIDVNAGTFLDHEAEYLCWLVETIQSELDLPLCLDSANPRALRAAMKLHRGEPMINSISMEPQKFRALLPVITARPCHVVGLCMSQKSPPSSEGDRVRIATELINGLVREGIPLERIYIDPLVQPVAVTGSARVTLETMRRIVDDIPGVKAICGISNISFGLPDRQLLNRIFLTLAMSHGLSAAILDPTDDRLMLVLRAAQTLLGADPGCEGFISACRKDPVLL